MASMHSAAFALSAWKSTLSAMPESCISATSVPMARRHSRPSTALMLALSGPRADERRRVPLLLRGEDERIGGVERALRQRGEEGVVLAGRGRGCLRKRCPLGVLLQPRARGRAVWRRRSFDLSARSALTTLEVRRLLVGLAEVLPAFGYAGSEHLPSAERHAEGHPAVGRLTYLSSAFGPPHEIPAPARFLRTCGTLVEPCPPADERGHPGSRLGRGSAHGCQSTGNGMGV
jgi:hypothetical protein